MDHGSWENVQRKYHGIEQAAATSATPVVVTPPHTPEGKTAKLIGFAALVACGLVLYQQIQSARKDGGSALKVVGSTSTASIIQSSFPGFMFAVSYYGLRERVRTVVTSHAPGVYKERVPKSAMPLIVAGFVSTATESLLLSRYSKAEPFNLGTAVGILVGSMAAQKVF